jgi:ribonuclease P protein component
MTHALATLKTRADFLHVAASRARVARPAFILQAAKRAASDSVSAAEAAKVRIGFTASRKVGNAVVRNRAKRRLRALAAEVLPRLGRSGTDYVLVARAIPSERPFAVLVADLEGALRQLERPGDRLRSRPNDWAASRARSSEEA